MEDNFSLGVLRKKVDLSQLKGGLKAEQFDFGKKDKLKSVFDKIDSNHDGEITSDEIEQYVELLKNAAGADNKLNRKEAKNAGLGSRKDINKFLKQAIELSKGIKQEQVSSEIPTVPENDTPTPIPENDSISASPIIEETPVVTDQEPVIYEENEGEQQEELTPQDALKNLFGDKRKASVKIDGSATGLGKAYQGEVRLPNGEKLEDGKFPENLRITLPPSYGENATMKLKLIDPENGIYETSAKDRNFQIVTDENGNVTIQSVNVDELAGKLNANLEEYKRIEAERAAKAAAEAEAESQADEVQPTLSKEEIEAAKQKQRQSAQIASDMYQACKGTKWDSVSGKQFQSALQKINSGNASQVLSQYAAQHPEETFVDMICSEKSSDDDVRKAALNHVMNALAAEAKAKGVPENEVNRLVKDFQTSANKEFDSWGVIDPKKMENAMEQLHGLVMGKELNAGEIDAQIAMQSIKTDAKEQYNSALGQFNDARAEEGWTEKTGDFVLGIFGCDTKKVMEDKLDAYLTDYTKLNDCKTEDEFKTAYKEVFGIEFDNKKVAAYKKAEDEYTAAYNAKASADIFQNLYSEARGLDYDSYKAKVMEYFPNKTSEDIDRIVADLSVDYMKNNPHADKKDVLRHWVDLTKQEQIKMYDQIAQGRSLEQMSAETDAIRQAAFGNRDIVNDVVKYNTNQQLTGQGVEIAGEIALTAALQAVPGAGQFAAARLAAQMAKWGTRAAKFAKYVPKAVTAGEKFAAGAKKAKTVVSESRVVKNAASAANAVKNSRTGQAVASTTQRFTAGAKKVADAIPTGVKESAGRIVRGSDAAFEATFAVNITDGKSVEDSVKKALQNAAFAGAGATSAELAPYIAQSLGCSSKVATEIVEHSLDVASSAGISYGVTGGYTSDDALVDIFTGVVMNRLGKGFKGKKATDAPTGNKPNALDQATANNSAQPGGPFGKKKFEEVKQQVSAELESGATPQRAAELHNEADKLQIQSRQQGREIKHIIEDKVGVYDSPSLGKVDLANETDLSKLAKCKKEIEQWFDGKKDVRGDASRDKQALLDKINSRMAELQADPSLQGQKVKSEVVDEMNANTEKDAASVLANQGKPLSPHGAATLDDKLKLMNSVDELEAMKKQLESRVGYQVQGVDHAAATIKKIDAKIANLKAHQADFSATLGKIDDAISAGKGLSSDDLNTIRAFAEKCSSADELKQIVDKMNSSKAIRSFGGSKKLIGEINAKIESIKAKAVASSETGAATPIKSDEVPDLAPSEVPASRPAESQIDPHNIELSESPRSVLENQSADVNFVDARRNMPQNTENTQPRSQEVKTSRVSNNADSNSPVKKQSSPTPATNYKDSKYFSETEIEKFANSTESDPWDIAAELQEKGFEPTEANVLRPGDPQAFVSYHNPKTNELYTYAYDKNGQLSHKSLTKVEANADGSFTRKSDLIVTYNKNGTSSVALKEGDLNILTNNQKVTVENSSFTRPLQDRVFTRAEKINAKDVSKFLQQNNIEYRGGVIAGNGTVAFNRNGSSYQLSYEDGRLSALRVQDSKGNKTYYGYDEAGNRTAISRDAFIEKFQASNQKFDKALDELDNNQQQIISAEDKMAMSQIGNNISRANTADDLAKAQEWLNKMPDCSQKTHLQKQLNEKLAALNKVKTSSDIRVTRPDLDKYKINSPDLYGKIDEMDFAMNLSEKYGYEQDRYGDWSSYHTSNPHSAWKMHLYSVNKMDYQMMCDVVLPYLRDNGIEHKCLGFRHEISEQAMTIQAGKAFTIYPKSNAEMEKIARDLDYIIKNNGLNTTNTKITGDNNLGNSGRLFYRYEYKSKSQMDDVLDITTKEGYDEYQYNYYDENRGEGKYLASDMTSADDPWFNFDPADPNSKPNKKN